MIREAQSWIFEWILDVRVQYSVQGPFHICSRKPGVDLVWDYEPREMIARRTQSQPRT